MRLPGLKELFVVSRGSTLGYSGDEVDTRAIGQALGVRYVLYGSVRREAGRLRIATELSDAETGAIIRSDKYEGDLSDLFTLQDRISASVVGTIAPHVLEHELVRVRRKHPQNMTAYDFLLQALDQLYRMDAKCRMRGRVGCCSRRWRMTRSMLRHIPMPRSGTFSISARVIRPISRRMRGKRCGLPRPP